MNRDNRGGQLVMDISTGLARWLGQVLSISEDIPREPFFRDLMDLEIFPDARQSLPMEILLRMDLLPATPHQLYVDVYQGQGDNIGVTVVSRNGVTGQSPLDVYLKKTCDEIGRLARNYGSAVHRDRTTRG